MVFLVCRAGSAATGMRLLQVENNSISAAFGAMGTYTSRMHHYLAGPCIAL